MTEIEYKWKIFILFNAVIQYFYIHVMPFNFVTN